MGNSLLSSETGIQSDYHIDSSDKNYRFPSVSSYRFVVFTSSGIMDNPIERDESIMDPVELKEDSKQHGDWRMDEYGVEWSVEGRWVL